MRRGLRRSHRDCPSLSAWMRVALGHGIVTSAVLGQQPTETSLSRPGSGEEETLGPSPRCKTEASAEVRTRRNFAPPFYESHLPK